MTENTGQQPPSTPDESPSSRQQYETLVRQITEKVWAMWREELRIDRERRGVDPRHKR